MKLLMILACKGTCAPFQRSGGEVPRNAPRSGVPAHSSTMVLKLCFATPWCVVWIFQGRRTKVNSVQFY